MKYFDAKDGIEALKYRFDKIKKENERLCVLTRLNVECQHENSFYSYLVFCDIDKTGEIDSTKSMNVSSYTDTIDCAVNFLSGVISLIKDCNFDEAGKDMYDNLGLVVVCKEDKYDRIIDVVPVEKYIQQYFKEFKDNGLVERD